MTMNFEARETARQQRIHERADRAATKAATKAREKTLARLKAKAPMSPTQYRSALKKLDIPIVGAAPLFGISPRQAQRIAADQHPVPRLVAKVLELLISGKIQKEDLL